MTVLVNDCEQFWLVNLQLDYLTELKGVQLFSLKAWYSPFRLQNRKILFSLSATTLNDFSLT